MALYAARPTPNPRTARHYVTALLVTDKAPGNLGESPVIGRSGAQPWKLKARRPRAFLQ